MGKQIWAREAVKEALLPLPRTGFHTNANALHLVLYKGELHHWPDFRHVRTAMNGQQWSNRVIKLNLDTRDLDQNKVFVGDEAGVQGRFQEAIGQTLGKVFEAQGLDIQFADFKCLPNLGNKVPDCTMKTSTNELKLVGELKVPWPMDFPSSGQNQPRCCLTFNMTDITQIFKGTKIALPGSTALQLDASTWVIDEKLYENKVDGMREPPFDPEDPPSVWEAKYLCHNLESPHDQAFMRVYCQGPDEGTDFLLPEIRAQQAEPQYEMPEATARKAFKQAGCGSVPPLLGCGQSVQGGYGPVPGGYITYLVWKKVPGLVLSRELFWSFDRSERDIIRHKFHLAYAEMVSCGWCPGGTAIWKIIWDSATAGLWINGFSSSFPADDEDKLSDDQALASFGLIKPLVPGYSENYAEWQR
ncbi:unnamed protein product [Penicillium salamii]|nr:unnamed protein product [Penicillium salamii]CAG8358940.1 unnamed protein product [Penicillium salamii]